MSAIVLCLWSAAASADFSIPLKPASFSCVGQSAVDKEGIIIGMGTGDPVIVTNKGALVYIGYTDRPGYEHKYVKAQLPMLNSEGVLSIQQVGPNYNMVLFNEVHTNELQRLAADLQSQTHHKNSYEFIGRLTLDGVEYNLLSCATSFVR